MKRLPARIREKLVALASVTAVAALAGCGPIPGHSAHGHTHTARPSLAAGGTSRPSGSASPTASASDSAPTAPGTTSPAPGTAATSPDASPTLADTGSDSPSAAPGTTSPAPGSGMTSPTGSVAASPTLASPGTTSASPTPSTTSASPTPSTTSASPVPTLTSAPATTAPVTTAPTAPASSGSVCVKTTNAQCDYPAGSSITGVSSVPYVNQNIWAGSATYKQTLYAISPTSWYVVANANTHFGGVLTFPNTGWDMSGAVDSHSAINTSFSTTIPVNAQTAGWAAYDLWFNNWADEVMIQTDITANSYYNCDNKASATFSGQPWHLCVFGSERVWKPGTDDQHLQNRPSGTLDLQPFLTWMEANGYLPAKSTWTAGSYGFEICDTGGASETFRLNSFTWDPQTAATRGLFELNVLPS